MDNEKRIKAILKKLCASNVKIHIKLSNKSPFILAVSIPLRPFIYFSGNLDLLNNNDLEGVIAHELIHIYKKDIVTTWILPIALIIIGIGLFTFSLNFLFLIFSIAGLTLYFILAPYIEKRADLLAANTIGKSVLIHALIRLEKLGVKSTWPHKKLESRIKRLENFKLKDKNIKKRI